MPVCSLQGGFGESPPRVSVDLDTEAPGEACQSFALAMPDPLARQVARHGMAFLVPLSPLPAMLKVLLRNNHVAAAEKTSFCLYSNSEGWRVPLWGCLARVLCPYLYLSPNKQDRLWLG